MRTDEESKVINAMATFGGSFVRNLAEYLRTADHINFVKMRRLFTDYWCQYELMAKSDEESKGEMVDKENELSKKQSFDSAKSK